MRSPEEINARIAEIQKTVDQCDSDIERFGKTRGSLMTKGECISRIRLLKWVLGEEQSSGETL